MSTTRSKLTSTDRMSNSGYHANGQPTWWARIGKGDSATFLEIPKVRGDSKLDVEVDLPPGTIVYIGAGKGSNKTVRETVETTAIEPSEADGPAAWIAWHEHRHTVHAGQNQDKVFEALTTPVGKYTIGMRATRGELQAERLIEIERLKALIPSREKLLTERAALVARLAEIDAELAR